MRRTEDNLEYVVKTSQMQCHLDTAFIIVIFNILYDKSIALS